MYVACKEAIAFDTLATILEAVEISTPIKSAAVLNCPPLAKKRRQHSSWFIGETELFLK